MRKHVLFDKRAKALRAFRDGFVLSAGEGSDGGSLLDLSPRLADDPSGAQLARLMGGDVFPHSGRLPQNRRVGAGAAGRRTRHASSRSGSRMAKKMSSCRFEIVARNWTAARGCAPTS